MKWNIRENSIVMCQGLTLDILPDIIPSNIHLLYKNNILCVSAENIAGLLPCKNGNAIIIEPKYPTIKPLELVSYINNFSGISVGTEDYSNSVNEVNLHTIADLFIQQLLLMQSRPKKFSRIEQNVITSSIRGRVNWLKTYMAQVQGGLNTVYTSIHNASYEIPENILIAAAAEKISGFYDSTSIEFDVLKPWIKMSSEYNWSHEKLFTLQKNINEQKLSGAHAFYIAPVLLSKIILGFDGVDKFSAEDDGLLFNMPSLYEEFCRIALQRIGSKHGFSVQKGLSPRSFLFYNGLCEMVPDIVIYEGSDVKAICDVKYKLPDSKDYYQIFTYMKYAKLDKAYIFTPCDIEDATLTSFEGSKIHMVKVDSSSHYEIEAVMENIIKDIV